ncbi:MULTISPECIES: TraB/GumN family protein [unclassified Lysobacter]|uniref:TraB/GumN family protein n=1 Tax=unclassified Lysobacter TaxID=2635362 RepID=UPI001C24B539|nr:TraB/GumN family protein [Lysobacter sp. MMG2]MBU8974899.1 TraB/GumN family protein [Lysobacter sp. MMG2]
MRRRLKLLLLSLAAAAGLMSVALAVEQAHAPAPAAPAQVAAAAPAATPPVPLLWKVSDRDNAVYLLGSFHLLRESDYPLSGDIDQAFAASDKVVFEVPPEQMLDPSIAQRFLAAAGYADGRTLSQVLPAAMREKFNRILAQRGSSIAQFDGYEPWFVNLSLMLGISQQMGFRPDKGLDQTLIQQALASGKATGGLESLDTQLNVLDSTPMAEQVTSLKEFLDKPTEMPGMLEDLHGAWRAGDIARLDKLAREEMRDKTPQTYRIVNVQRNDAWVPQIQQMLDGQKKGETLVVVGALHLLGEDGVIEKLRAKGYTVERVCSVCAADEATKAVVETK